jgi:uncharacterized cupin superfamily protein
MYGMDEFFESVKELNEEELFYKEYYRIKKESPEKLGEYLEMLDREMMQEKGLWLPEIRQTSASYFTEYFVEDIRKNVEISIHNRYTPLFLHKHAFFEMVYVYSGQCENTIDGNKIVMNKGDICIIAPDVTIRWAYLMTTALFLILSFEGARSGKYLKAFLSMIRLCRCFLTGYCTQIQQTVTYCLSRKIMNHCTVLSSS